MRTVLLTRFSAIGDVAMTVPVVYSACRCYPQTRFVLLTRPAMVPIFADAPANLCVAGVDLKDGYKGVGGIYRLASRILEEYAPAVYLDLQNEMRTRLLAAFLRLRGVPGFRIDKGSRLRRRLTRRHNKVMLPLRGMRDVYAAVFDAADMQLRECFDGLFGGRGKAPAPLYASISAPKAEGERWVGIAPFAAYESKIYPPELMEQVVRRLAAEPRVRIFLLGGGRQETEILERWADTIPGVSCPAGKRCGFAAELALFNHLDCMLTMDSANMQLAAIAGTPTVSIWGATHPYCGFTAWRQSEADTLQLPVPCRPCSVYGNRPCLRGDYLCLRGIRPEMVASRVIETLNSK